jgi:hypothetical protein
MMTFLVQDRMCSAPQPQLKARSHENAGHWLNTCIPQRPKENLPDVPN